MNTNQSFNLMISSYAKAMDEARLQAKICKDERRKMSTRLLAKKLCGKATAKALKFYPQGRDYGFPRPKFSLAVKSKYKAGPLCVGICERIGKRKSWAMRTEVEQKLLTSIDLMGTFDFNSGIKLLTH